MTAPMPWVKSYPPGVRWDIDVESQPVWRMLDDAAQQWGDRPALDYLGRQMSFRELQALAGRFAAGLAGLGLERGARVGLYLPNCPHYLIAFFGVLRAGGIVVNYSPLDAEPTLLHKIADSDTDYLITLDVALLYPRAAKLLGQSRLKALIVGSLGEFARAPIPPQCDVPYGTNQLRFADLLANDGRHTVPALGDLTAELAVLQYTGGTTGVPKGAMLTHANISTAGRCALETTQGAQPSMRPGTERVLVVLPLFHIYAELVMFLAMRLGAELVLHLKFDPEAVARDIAAKGITVMFGVPTMFLALMGHARAHGIDLSSLTHCGSGGAPLPVELIEPFRAQTGVLITEGWGMSETVAAGTFTPRHGVHKAGSCGLPLPRAIMKAVDVDDPARDLAVGERGELCIRSPYVMRGYWKKPDATAAAMTPDGYFRTGDVGYIDADGFVFIIDRSKDMLLCGGFNVYPRIIEDAIYAHPDVAEVSVIGIHDEYRGQSPKAFVRLKDGAPPLTLEALQAFLLPRIGKHEMVKALEIRAELPKTPVGKLSKKELYEEEARRAAERR